MGNTLLVVGSQRSGTTMLMTALASDPAHEVHQEGSEQVMQDYRLISAERLSEVREQSAARLLVAKPLCDSQWTQLLLRTIDGSRAVWMFRSWWDVVNSMTRLWPGHFLEIADRFRAGDEQWLGWRAENIAGTTREGYLRLLDEAHDDASAAAAFWWLRNRGFFDQQLPEHPAFVRALRYRTLVQDPTRWLRALCRFAGGGDQLATDQIHRRSVAKNPRPKVSQGIAAACDATLDALQQYADRCW